ncbi:hypothetical protein MVI01_71750 [Myxococcus virescens]|nr:hypothetical protein MVI01_71750 [Myxococcus virescens]
MIPFAPRTAANTVTTAASTLRWPYFIGQRVRDTEHLGRVYRCLTQATPGKRQAPGVLVVPTGRTAAAPRASWRVVLTSSTDPCGWSLEVEHAPGAEVSPELALAELEALLADAQDLAVLASLTQELRNHLLTVPTSPHVVRPTSTWARKLLAAVQSTALAFARYALTLGMPREGHSGGTR